MIANAFVQHYSTGGFTNGCLVLDELMTMDTGILRAISSRKKLGVQFIVLGDVNQHPAIGDPFQRNAVQPVKRRRAGWGG